MKLPSDNVARGVFAQDLIRKCNASRETRREFYRLMRAYYLFGCDPSTMLDNRAKFNNVQPHIDQVASFMFSPETTRFTINIGPSCNSEENYKVPAMIKGLQREWHGDSDGGIDTDFNQALIWAHVYGSMFVKVRWRSWKRTREDGEIEEGGQCQHFLVQPHNFGVLREDKRGLYKQEAFCETYFITKTQLINELRAGAHKHADRIIDQIQQGAVSDVSQVAGSAQIDRITVTSIQGGSISGVTDMLGGDMSMIYRPTVVEDLVEMNELYVYDDDIDDYRIMTMMNPSVPIWDRPIGHIFVPGAHPYNQVCPVPDPDYFWGHSAVERLVILQDMLNERVLDIKHLLRKQAHPSYSMTGVNSIPDELAMTLDTPSGILALDSPAAAVKENTVTIPSDLWNDVKEIKGQFDEVSGMPPVNQGQAAQGVRSKGHAQLLSTMGSTRPKNRALIIEDSLDALATLIVKVLKKYDKRPYAEEKQDGKQFFPQQFTSDFEAKVDGHSSSPVFMENFEEKVMNLFEHGIIDKEEVLLLLDIPLKELLKHKLITKIEPAEAERADKEDKLKLASINSKRSR